MLGISRPLISLCGFILLGIVSELWNGLKRAADELGVDFWSHCMRELMNVIMRRSWGRVKWWEVYQQYYDGQQTWDVHCLIGPCTPSIILQVSCIYNFILFIQVLQARLFLAMPTNFSQKRRSERIRKRKKTVFQKAYELGKFPEIEIAIIIFQNGRYFTFNSTKDESWPPSMKEIVGGVDEFSNTKLIQ